MKPKEGVLRTSGFIAPQSEAQGNNLDLWLPSEVGGGGQSHGTEPVTCGTWHYSQNWDGVRE